MGTINVTPETEKSKSKTEKILISLGEVGEMLGISERTVRRLSQMGKLPRMIKLGHSIRMSHQELLSYIKRLEGRRV